MDWFQNEMIDGLTKLMSLSLDRTPASDVLQITAATWIDAATWERAWERERDTARIRGAFATLSRTCDHWPSPKQFLAALPDSTQLRLAGAGERPVDPPELREVLRTVTPEEVESAKRRLHAAGASAYASAAGYSDGKQRRRTDGRAAAAGADQ